MEEQRGGITQLKQADKVRRLLSQGCVNLEFRNHLEQSLLGEQVGSQEVAHGTKALS